MKYHRNLLVIIALLALLASSCSKEGNGIPNYPSNSRLKQIVLYQDITSTTPIAIVQQFEYDESGRISKTSSPMYENGVIKGTISYNLYEYNFLGQLSKISTYNANSNSPDGFINLYNKVYSYYGNGLLARENTEYPAGTTQDFIIYDYDGDRLTKVSMFSNNLLSSYTINNYDNSGNLVKESTYAANGEGTFYTIHSYNGNLRIKSDVYVSSSNDHYRTITRTYDSNGNLVILESKELMPYSNMTSFVQRYEYTD